jgi:hypothetical protein
MLKTLLLERRMNAMRIAALMGIIGGRTSLHCLLQMPVKSAF